MDYRGSRPLYHRLGLRVDVWPQCPKSVFLGMGCGLGWTLSPVCDAQRCCSLLCWCCGVIKVLKFTLLYVNVIGGGSFRLGSGGQAPIFVQGPHFYGDMWIVRILGEFVSHMGRLKTRTWHRETGQLGTISQGWTSRDLFHCASRSSLQVIFAARSIIWAAYRLHVYSFT